MKNQLELNMNLGNLRLILIPLICFIPLILKAEPINGSSVEIQVLDKITAKVRTFETKIGQTIEFESLKIEIFACFKNPPEEIPEDFVLLRIYDLISMQFKEIIYQGWMISSSPNITPLEHPIYDLWLKDCKIDNDSS